MENQTEKRTKPRSPSYPGIDLETAIERARVIWTKEREHLISIDAVFADWQYKGRSGPALTALAALKKFGLIEDAGSGPDRKVKLSKLALDIIWDEREESPDRDRLIKEAALMPSIHKELWDKYGRGLPSDAALKHELRQRDFTESAIPEFIQEYRDTLSFAKLDKDDNISGHDVDAQFQKGQEGKNMSSGAASGQTPSAKFIDIPIPFTPTEIVTMKVPYPLTQEAWERMTSILNVYKPMIVPQSEKDTESEES